VFLFVMGILVGIVRDISSKACCDWCGKWMNAETLNLAPGAGAAAWHALRRGDDAAARLNLARTSGPHPVGSLLTIEHCPSCPADRRPSAVYLSVKDITAPGVPALPSSPFATLFKPRHSAHVRTHADHIGLLPEEVGAFAASFARLKDTIESHPAVFSGEQAAARAIALAEAAAIAQPTQRVARIEPVEPGEAGTILTRANAISQTFIVVISALGGFALAMAPAGVLASLDPKPPDWVAGVALFWMFAYLALNLRWLIRAYTAKRRFDDALELERSSRELMVRTT
jgi:hypothetical protein